MIYRKSKLINAFSLRKQDLNKYIPEKSNGISMNEKDSYNKISNIFNSIYEDFFPTIISNKSKDTFINEINEKSQDILLNNFTEKELQIPSMEIMLKKIKEEIRDKINKISLFLEKSIKNIEKQETNLYYLNNFRKHCIKTDNFAYHLCDNGKIGKFIILKTEKKVNGKDLVYVFCHNCHFCYLGNCIKMYCISCKKNYFSSILEDNENMNCPPATWDSYHCGNRKKEIMKCLKCKNILYLDLKTNRLICLKEKCNFSSKPEHIIWGCYLCGADFKSKAKIYNPLEFMIIKKVINKALLYKIKAVAPFLPCCHGKIDNNTIFYHNKNCKGKLYKYSLNGGDLIVCEKCQAINKFRYFSWLCPLCSSHFVLNDVNKLNKKKNFYTNSAINLQANYNKNNFLNKNSRHKTSSVLKLLQNSSYSIDNNIFGFGFYTKKSKINEYDKSLPKNKGNINFFEEINKSELNIKNESEIIKNSKSSEKNYRSIEQNKENKKRIRKRSTLKDILKIRKNTPSFGKKKSEKNEEKEDDLTSRADFKTERNLFLKINDNKSKKENKIEDFERNIYQKNIKSKNEGNRLIYKRMKRRFYLYNNSFNNSKEVDVKSNIDDSKKNYKQNIYFNENNQKYNNYYNINNINNINIINSIDIQKDKKEKVYNIKTNDSLKKEDILLKKKKLFNYNLENIRGISENNLIIKKISNRIVTKNNLIGNKLSPTNKRTLEKKYIDKNNEKDNTFNKTFENYHKMNLSSLNMESINNEIKSREDNYTKIEKYSNYNKFSKKKSTSESINNIFIHKFSWKKKRFGNFKNNKITIEKDGNDAIKTNLDNKKQSLDDIMTKEKIKELSNNYSIPTFDDKDYNYIKLIGEGSYGRIYLVEDKNTKEEYALKKVICTSYNELLKFKKEFELLYSLQNPNIMSIYKLQIKNLDFTTSCLYVLMERAQFDWNIEIKRRKLAKKYYKEKEIISILKQLSHGLFFLQKNKIAHRDIKPQNILIFPNNIYKIADMGEAKEFDKNKMQIATLRGSELFMSPLLYQGFKFNKKNITHNPYKSDMFSLGLCFLYAISLNLRVLEYIREISDMNSIKNILNKFLDKNIYSEKLIKIIYRMIDLQEEKRFDFEELVTELTKF